MIHIDRTKVERPEWFGSREWEMKQSDLMEFLSIHVENRAQRRLDDLLGSFPQEVIDAVVRLFESRCAMCETLEPAGNSHLVKRFRPVVTQESKQPYANAYGALLWENLILVCQDCDRAWGDRFPVDEPNLHDWRPSWSNLDYNGVLETFKDQQGQENSKLIDPTAQEPGHFLSFDANGLAMAIRPTQWPTSVLGQQTIDMFQLNRKNLLMQRHRVIHSDLVFPRLPMRSSADWGDPRDLIQLLADQEWDKTWEDMDRGVSGQYQGCRASAFARWLYSSSKSPMPWGQFQEVLHHKTVSFGLLQLLQLIGPYYEGLQSSLAGERQPKSLSARPELPRFASGSHPTRIASITPESPTSRPAQVSPAEEVKKESKPLSFSRRRVVEVKLQNFRHFAEATFTLPRVLHGAQSDEDKMRALVQEMRDARNAKDSHAPSTSSSDSPTSSGWKMLLGNNGAGKSSVLQAIAMALRADALGQEALKEKMIADLPRSVSAGQTEGFIEVWIEDRAAPVRLDFTTKEVKLTGATGDDPAQAFGHFEVLYLRGYGATRLLPPRVAEVGETRSLHTPPQEIRNLFDPYHALVDAEAWLNSIVGTEAQFQAFLALKDLLNLPTFCKLDFREWHGRQTLGLVSELKIVSEGPPAPPRFTPLEYFSAGYQAMVALCCDVMAGFGLHSGDMRQRTGVVLLDEIGTNLHPSWRLRVVQALRRTFPLLQFIASTHEPLCLRGLGEGEVCLLTLDEHTHQVTLRDDLPSPAIYRVDQLLTGDFFGLNTAYDPHEEEAFDLYYNLLVKERGQGLSPRENEILADLRRLLKDRLVVGNTTPERHVMKALEEAMRQSDEKEPVRLTGSPEAVRQATDLLNALPGNSAKLKY